MTTSFRFRIKNIKKHIIILLIIIANQYSITSQTSIIKGFVINENYSAIEYFTVALLNQNDSSIIAGSAFLDGKFTIDYINNENCILKISSVGYKPISMPIVKGQESLPDTFMMENLKLDEVIITARKPKIKQKEGKTIVTIEGTILEDIGSSLDVLKNIPNVHVNSNGEIGIFGKGSPLIIIDNREVSSIQELNILQSSGIKSIEVDKNPSATIKSDANSIIRITTKKNNNFSAEINNRSYFGRKYSNKIGIDLTQPYKKLRNIISYNHYLSNSLYYNDNYEINSRSDYQINNTTQSKNNSTNNTHNLLAGIEYLHDSTNTTNILYQLSFYDQDFTKHTNQQIIKSNVNPIYKEISLLTIENKNQHNICVNHTKTFNPANSFFISMDYAYVFSEEKTRIKESAKRSLINTENTNEDNYNVFTLSAKYTNQINDNKHLSFGIRSAIIRNNGYSNSINRDDRSINYTDKQNIKDGVSAIYCTYKYSKEKYNYNIGLRTEHTKTNTNLNSISITDSSYIHFFPSIQFSYNSNSIGFSLNYNHKIERPYFSDLNPTQTYYDSLSYRQGNPYLKPTIKRNLAIDFDIIWDFIISAEYTRYSNKIALASTNDNNNPDIIKYTLINLDKSERILLGISKSYNGKYHSFSTSSGIEFPFVNIPYLGAIKKVRKSSWYVSFSNDIAIGKKILLYTSFDYYSKSIDAITTFGSYCNLWAGASLKLFNKSLILSVDMDNLLNCNNNNWEDNFKYIISGGNNDFDNRIFRISVKYNFKNFKKIINSNNNSQELDRL